LICRTVCRVIVFNIVLFRFVFKKEKIRIAFVVFVLGSVENFENMKKLWNERKKENGFDVKNNFENLL